MLLPFSLLFYHANHYQNEILVCKEFVFVQWSVCEKKIMSKWEREKGEIIYLDFMYYVAIIIKEKFSLNLSSSLSKSF